MSEDYEVAARASAGVTLAGQLIAAKGRQDDAELLRLVNVSGDVEIRYACAYLAQAVFEAMVVSGVRPLRARRQMAQIAKGLGLGVDAVETALAVQAAEDLK